MNQSLFCLFGYLFGLGVILTVLTPSNSSFPKRALESMANLKLEAVLPPRDEVVRAAEDKTS
ncbi:MAG: hypothetical protein AAB677_02155 [Patescibacteria group bacterium]|mgnify:CR=1